MVFCIILFALLGEVLGDRIYLTTTPVSVTSTSDVYRKSSFSYPVTIRLTMSPVTSAMQQFSMSFYKLNIPFNKNYEGQIVMTTDGSPWKCSGFSSIPNGDVATLSSVPQPNSASLYVVDLTFREDGITVSINGVEVIDDIGGTDLASEIQSWDSGSSDVAVGFDPILDTLTIQLAEDIVCPVGTKKSGLECEECPIGTFSVTTDAQKCTDCAKGLSTLTAGASSDTLCIEVCKVPEVEEASSTSPKSGTIVASYTQVAVKCGDFGDFTFTCHEPSLAALGDPPSCKDSYQKTMICESDKGTIACHGEGQSIRILKVYWGSSTGGRCSEAATEDCVDESGTSSEWVYERCNGREECVLFANEKALGEVCPGLLKHLYVEHMCLTYPRKGYAWQRIPSHVTNYTIREQPLRFKYTPIAGANETRAVKLFDAVGREDRILWSDERLTLSKCRRSKEGLLSDWDNLVHDWTFTLTSNFLVLAREAIPVMRWDFEDTTDGTGCKDHWEEADIIQLRFRLMSSDLNSEAWFYTPWDPAESIAWKDIRQDEEILLNEKNDLRAFSVQVLSPTNGDEVELQVSAAARFNLYLKPKTYMLMGCTLQPQRLLVVSECEQTTWDILIQERYLEVSCDGIVYLNYVYSTSSESSCSSAWQAEFESLKFSKDTTALKYRFVPLPGDPEIAAGLYIGVAIETSVLIFPHYCYECTLIADITAQ